MNGNVSWLSAVGPCAVTSCGLGIVIKGERQVITPRERENSIAKIGWSYQAPNDVGSVGSLRSSYVKVIIRGGGKTEVGATISRLIQNTECRSQ
jgi:hypothetical protein